MIFDAAVADLGPVGWTVDGACLSTVSGQLSSVWSYPARSSSHGALVALFALLGSLPRMVHTDLVLEIGGRPC